MGAGVVVAWGSDFDAHIHTASWSILVHGGAGDVRSERVPLRVEGCRAAAREGAAVLRSGGSALDAVQRAVEALEALAQFNAGRGSCLTREGTVELDASIMEGTHLRAGGVCALPPFLHPVAIARAVLEDGEHVLYADRGAERFALEHGFSRVLDDELITEEARARLDEVRAAAALSIASSATAPSGPTPHTPREDGGGTVGAVARDARGAVAAATSTGGRVNKRIGRVGDSPIIGAGTYADDEAGACSTTGDGEAILRVCLAKAAVDSMRAGASSEEAARSAIALLGARAGGRAGIILVDRLGRLGAARNTRGMPWALASAENEFAGA